MPRKPKPVAVALSPAEPIPEPPQLALLPDAFEALVIAEAPNDIDVAAPDQPIDALEPPVTGEPAATADLAQPVPVEDAANDQANESSDGLSWVDEGWTAKVQKNEDDEGWAVSMTRDGDAEPVLVSPWTMGRDKKNPKPLNPSDFKTLLKAARDVLGRHEAQLRAKLHKSITVSHHTLGTVRVDLDIVPDEDDPVATLTAWNAEGEEIARSTTSAGFALNSKSATRWVTSGFEMAG